MDMENNEELIQRLKEYDKMHFCLLVILYYHKNISNIKDLTQINSKNLMTNLPSGIKNVINLYRLGDRIKSIGEESLEEFLGKERDYLNKNIKSIFSLWNILFSQFVDLHDINRELMIEVFSELNIYSIEDLRKLLYVGENFNENSLSELLSILIRIKNYQEIHIINYNVGSINPDVCLKRVRDELYYTEPDRLESLIKKIVIVKEPQLNFEYLNTYIEQNAAEKFIIVIGMERLAEIIGKGEININLMQSNLNLGTSEIVNWELLIDKINKLYTLIVEDTSFLLTVYIVDNVLDDAKQKICQHYRDELVFDVLCDNTRLASDDSTQDRKLFGELLDSIFNDNNAYEIILAHKEKLSQDNFAVLKAYFYLYRNDYFQAISELEKLSDDADINFRYLLAVLYNITGEVKVAYGIFKEIYEKDKYYPNLFNSIVYSLRDNDNQDELLSWIEKGLEVNPHDPVMVQHLANYYTETGDYMASAEQWKILYDLTGDLFYTVLCNINYILFSTDKSQMSYIHTWVEEMVSMYPQYADEINNRIGFVIADKIGSEEALCYFEKVAKSYDKCYCDAAKKIMDIYYKICSRKIDKKINQKEMESFAQKLLNHMLILTYSTQSVYSWNSYVYKLFSYDEWVKMSTRRLIVCLSELVKSFLKGDAATTRLIVDEKNIDGIEHCFEDYKGSKTLNLENINIYEYLIILLANGKNNISKGDIQAAYDIAYTFFRLASIYEGPFYKDISMCFGLLLWSGASMAIDAYVEGILSFVAAADRLMEIRETALLHEFGFVFEQFIYLYSGSLQIELDSSNLIIFEEYFNHMGYPKTLLYYILGMHEKIIGSEPSEFRELINLMEGANIFVLTKNESLENIIFIDALILAYYEIGELDKAGIYLQRWFLSIIMTLAEHVNIAYHFLIRYTNILMDLKDFNATIEIFNELIQIVEKLRELSFSSERSYLGNPADTIIRRLLYIYCEKDCYSSEGLKADELLCSVLINMVPKSIIEQRNGCAELVVDEMLLRKEEEYYLLFEELNHSRKKSVSDLVYKQTVDRFLETKKYLEENHPNFKPLKAYSLIGWNHGNPFEFLKCKLKEGEVFYRNILAEDYLIHILVTDNAYHMYSEKINKKELEELFAPLEDMINDSVYDLERMKPDSYIYLFENLTKILFQPLVGLIDLIDSLYYMPDHNLLHITPNFIRVNDKWGVEYFNKMELIIDYNNIGNSKREPNHWRNLCYVSDSQKEDLQEIRKTIDKFPDFTKSELNQFGYIDIRESVNILVIAAHGISEEFGWLYHGAKKLALSRKKQIDLNEFVIIHSATVENAIIIACSGGTPTNDKLEQNNGVWDSMLRKNVKNILYCKWDVSTKHTNKLLATILEEMQSDRRLLGEALNIAQRKMTHLNPILWAGLEVWKN